MVILVYVCRSQEYGYHYIKYNNLVYGLQIAMIFKIPHIETDIAKEITDE